MWCSFGNYYTGNKTRQHDTTRVQHEWNTTQHEYNTTQHEATRAQHETTWVQYDKTRVQHECNTTQHEYNTSTTRDNTSKTQVQYDTKQVQHEKTQDNTSTVWHNTSTKKLDSKDSAFYFVTKRYDNFFKEIVNIVLHVILIKPFEYQRLVILPSEILSNQGHMTSCVKRPTTGYET